MKKLFIISLIFIIGGIFFKSDYNIYANKAYDSIFEYNLRVYIANLLAIITCVWLNSKLYYEIKKIKNKIVLSNIFSITIIELIENIIFVFIAYLFEYEFINIVLCIIFRYMIKTVIGIIGTIPIYITNKFN